MYIAKPRAITKKIIPRNIPKKPILKIFKYKTRLERENKGINKKTQII